jgi:CheY-like chemotaxis protein
MQRLERVPVLRPPHAVPRPPSIVVVDDEPLVRQLLVRKLQLHGFDVREACDGDEALELVHRDQPDIVLTDLNMPHCDGERLCQMLKAEPATSPISVVLMTAATIDESLMRVLGFDDVLYKPLPRGLPDLLRGLIANRRGDVQRADETAGPVEGTRAWSAGR